MPTFHVRAEVWNYAFEEEIDIHDVETEEEAEDKAYDILYAEYGNVEILEITEV